MSDADLHKYVVTLKRREDLDEFYYDMETPGGTQYIPNRTVDLDLRRPYSRNTYYMLTHEEAQQLNRDPRVEAVTLYQPMPGIPSTAKIGEIFSTVQNRYHSSYHMIKQANGINTTYPYTNNTTAYASVFSNSNNNIKRGRDIDVLSIDGWTDPAHPEWLNASGQSRFVQYNWFQHSASLGYSYHGTNYEYGYYGSTYSDGPHHGTSATSLIAGRRFGWAPEANIYNLAPGWQQTSSGHYLFADVQHDYIMAWLNSKPVNPTYGIKNPTVISWSVQYHPWLFDTGVSKTTTLTDNLPLPLPNCYYLYNYSLNAGIYSFGPYSLYTIYNPHFRMLEAGKNVSAYSSLMDSNTDYTITVAELRDKYNLFTYVHTTDQFYLQGSPSNNWYLMLPYGYYPYMVDYLDISNMSNVVVVTPASNFSQQLLDGSSNPARFSQMLSGYSTYQTSDVGGIGYFHPTHRYTTAPQSFSGGEYNGLFENQITFSVSADGPIVVGALQADNSMSVYTGYGSRLDAFCYADKVISGSTYTSSFRPEFEPGPYYDNSSYSQSFFGGTSAANPITTGIAALYAESYRQGVSTNGFRSLIQNGIYSQPGVQFGSGSYGTEYNGYFNGRYHTNYGYNTRMGSPDRIMIAYTGAYSKRVVNPNTVTASELKTVFGDTDPVVLSDYYRGGSIVSNALTAVPQNGEISYSNLKAQGPSSQTDPAFDLISVEATTARSGQNYTITARGNKPAPENITVNITTTATGSTVYTITIPSGSASGTLTATLPSSGYFTQTAIITATGKYDSNRIELRQRTCLWEIVAELSPFTVTGTPLYFNYSGSGTIGDPYTANSTNQSRRASTASISFKTTVNGTVHYNFTVSSEYSFDVGGIYKNGGNIASGSGSDPTYTASGSISVIADDIIELRYSKDYSVDSGLDKLTLNSLYLI